jgi:hypothetical protein
VSTLLIRSSYSEETRARYNDFFKSHVAPLLGPSPGEYAPSTSSDSLMCDDHTPVEIGWVFKSTGETSVQYAIEALSSTDGAPIYTHQNLVILQNLAIAGQCQGFDISWSQKCTHSLLCPSRLVPQALQRDSQFFIGKQPDFVRVHHPSLTFISRHRSRACRHGSQGLLPPTGSFTCDRDPGHGHPHPHDRGARHGYLMVESNLVLLHPPSRVQRPARDRSC